MGTQIFVGRAKPPENTATAQTYGTLTVVVEVEGPTGKIVAADVLVASSVTRSFLVRMLVGRNLRTDLSLIARDLESNYHSTLQRAVIQALYDAGQKYLVTCHHHESRSKMRLADFTMGCDNAYLQSGIKAAKDAARILDATIDIFDGGFDSMTQSVQIEEAISRNCYDGFIVYPYDASGVTSVIHEAMEKGILVSVFNTPLGGRDLCDGEQLWEPGTVAFVGGQTHSVYAEWIERIVGMVKAMRCGGGEILIITGPKAGANGKNVDDVLMQMLPGTGIEQYANIETRYTTREAYEHTRAAIRLCPRLRFVISNYSGMTQGVVRAVQEANLQNQIKVFDFGGSRWALKAVQDGRIEMTGMMLPYTETARAVEAVVFSSRGKETQRFIDLTKLSPGPSTTFVTKKNVDKFVGEYN
jgi:ribose transport system substrate-binding protein